MDRLPPAAGNRALQQVVSDAESVAPNDEEENLDDGAAAAASSLAQGHEGTSASNNDRVDAANEGNAEQQSANLQAGNDEARAADETNERDPSEAAVRDASSKETQHECEAPAFGPPPPYYGPSNIDVPLQFASTSTHHPVYLIHQQQPQQPPPPVPPPPPQALESHPALAMAQFYESRMRDHAAAYANAAAGAAWAASQIAAAAAEFASTTAAVSTPTLTGPLPYVAGGGGSAASSNAAPPPGWIPPPLVAPSMQPSLTLQPHQHPHPQVYLPPQPPPPSMMQQHQQQHSPMAVNPILVYGPVPPGVPLGEVSPTHYAAATPTGAAWNHQHPRTTTTTPPTPTIHVYGGGLHPMQHSQPLLYQPNEEANAYHQAPFLGEPAFASSTHPPQGPFHNPRQQHQQQHSNAGGGRRKKKRQQHFHSDGDSSTVSVPRRVTVSSSTTTTTTRRRQRLSRPGNDVGRDEDTGTDAVSKSSSGRSSSFRPSPSAESRKGSKASTKEYPTEAGCEPDSSTPPSGEEHGPTGVTARQGQPRALARNRHREDDDLSSSTATTAATAATTVKAASRPSSKKKPRGGGCGGGDEAILLVGRTGVCALYELCSKRRKVPSIRFDVDGEDFLCTIELDGGELGSGRGRTKSSAKQEAARKAVQALVPGVRFDPSTGILADAGAVELPTSSLSHAGLGRSTTTEKNSLDDLAPNLAKRLAIGRDDQDVSTVVDNSAMTDSPAAEHFSFGLSSHASANKRSLNLYPGTSTTSDEEDESSYYASRGANVCSALLHAMVQIDGRIREAPDFRVEFKPLSSSAAATISMSRSCPSEAAPLTALPADTTGDEEVGPKASEIRLGDHLVAQATGTASAPEFGDRGFFSCIATLRLYENPPIRSATEGSADEDAEQKPPAFQVLTATATGRTKKESRQMASARLLALLFPECKTLLEVKAAAEAAREAYGASKKSNKAPHKMRGAGMRRRQDRTSRSLRRPQSSVVSFVISRSTNDPPLPESLRSDLGLLLGCTVDRSDGAQAGVGHSEGDGSMALRLMSRQRQLDSKVELALQAVNELDDEGRSLPLDLTDDDVGRTILRRAVPGDLGRIKRLLAAQPNSSPRPNFRHSSGDEPASALATQLWSSSCIVLLLCRAIAAYEDPPLGCAILALGFSMDSGPFLHVTQLASEHHLPKERFIECLQGFARAMKCTLQVPDSSSCRRSFPGDGEEALSVSDLRTILSKRLQAETRGGFSSASGSTNENDDDENNDGCSIKRISSPLQSVLEESEVSESSSVEKRPPAKRSNKPSKRSRFA